MAFNPAGGNISGASDIAFSNPIEDHVLTFDQSLGKWRNRSPFVSKVNPQSVTSYTPTLSDAGVIIESTGSSPCTITVPANAAVAFADGVNIGLRQYGSGQVTIVAAGGVTIRSRGGAYNLGGQYAEAVLTKRSTNEWILSGDITT